MCASCGCGKVDDQHGDDRHLTMKDLKAAADAAEITVQEAAGNIQTAARQTAQQPNGNAQQQGAAQGQQTSNATQQRGKESYAAAPDSDGRAQQREEATDDNMEAQQAANRSQEETKERLEQPQGNR